MRFLLGVSERSRLNSLTLEMLMAKIAFGKQLLTSLNELVAPTHTALVVVDAQNDFCSTGGCLEQMPDSDMRLMKSFVHNTVTLVEAARKAGVLVIFTKATNYPGGLYKSAPDLARKTEYLNPERPLICAAGTWGDDIIDDFKVSPGDIVLGKHRHNSFMGTELDVVLRSNAKQTVVVTGVTTERCVLATVAGAIAHDYYVVVPYDCVSSQNVEMHKAALLVMSGNLMKDGVTESAKIVECWAER